MRPASRLRCHGLAILAGLVILTASTPAGAQGSSDQLAEFIDATADILQLAANQVQETENQQARRVLDQAKQMHERSLEFMRQGRNAQAFNSSRRAREAALHAARLAREARNEELRVQLRLERFNEYRDQIAERAQDQGHQRALRFVQEAEEQALRAHEHYRQGNHDLAAHLIESAEQLLVRANRLLFEGGGPQRLEREIERTRQAIDTIAERLADDADGAAARDLLASARAALGRAEEMARRGESMRALRTLRLARNLASQAADATAEGLDAQSVRTQLERLDVRLEVVSERVDESPAASARDALDRARHHRDLAADLLDQGELEPSLRHIKAAFDLLNAARDLTR